MLAQCLKTKLKTRLFKTAQNVPLSSLCLIYHSFDYILYSILHLDFVFVQMSLIVLHNFLLSQIGVPFLQYLFIFILCL